MMLATVELLRVATSGAEWQTGGYDAGSFRVPPGWHKWRSVIDRWLWLGYFCGWKQVAESARWFWWKKRQSTRKENKLVNKGTTWQLWRVPLNPQLVKLNFDYSKQILTHTIALNVFLKSFIRFRFKYFTVVETIFTHFVRGINKTKFTRATKIRSYILLRV